MKTLRAALLLLLNQFLILSLIAQSQLKIANIYINQKLYTQPISNNFIELAASTRNITFEFEKIKGDSISYFYRINGSQIWNETPYPTVQFHDIQGGEFILEVKAKTESGFTKPFIFTINKEKPFFKKYWFWPSIGAYIFLIFGIAAYLFSLYDFRNKLKVQYLRNQIASDLHDEVGSNLNSISIFVEVLKKKVKQNPDLLSIIDKISLNSEETVSLLRETVWSINPNNDTSEKLFDRMKAQGFEILSVRKIAFHFENKLDLKNINMTMEQRRNLYLIYKEAINNIIKHAKATKVSVKIAKENNKINIEITDNGCGFDKNEVFDGNGLKNFQNRGSSNGIEVSVDSELKKGTTVAMVATV